MANSKLKSYGGDIISVESLTIGDAAESIATSGGTIPSNCTEIHLYPAAALHWHPASVTPTASIGHAVAANEMFMLTHAQQAALIFSDDDNDQTILAVYKK